MGKGLIPADLETWKPRRRAIVPAFHRAYLEAMVRSCAATLPRAYSGSPLRQKADTGRHGI